MANPFKKSNPVPIMQTQPTNTPIPASDDAIARAAAREEQRRLQSAANIADDDLSPAMGSRRRRSRSGSAMGSDSYSGSISGA